MTDEKATTITDRFTRIAINACMTGLITSATILATVPAAGDYTMSFIIAAVMSGLIAAAREIREHMGDGTETTVSKTVKSMNFV